MKEILEKEYWEQTSNIGEIKRSPIHPVVKFFAIQRIDYMKKHIDFNLINMVLDVGCGTGFSSIHFPSHMKLIGLDFSYRNLTINPLDNKVQSSAYLLPFEKNSFDLVYGWDFLHHLEEPELCVNEMARVTKKYLVLFEPNRNNPIQYLYGLYNKNEKGTLQFNRKKLLGFLDNLKFKLIACDTIGWIFAGASPTFTLPIVKHLPFSHKVGISNVLICEKIEHKST